ncbi:MAG: tyrosine/phenylalanine carboxypeptidase domain-containing protein [Candidatus Rifleibacteriota bacterium]
MNFQRIKNILMLFILLISVCSRAQTLPEPANREIEADKQLYKHRRTVAFTSRLNPLSASQKVEKKKFFEAMAQNKVYNPVFSFKPIPDKLRNFYFADVELPQEGFYSEILKSYLELLKTKAAIILTSDPDEFSRLCCELYPAPEPELILEAHKILREVKVTEYEKTLSPLDLKKILEKALQDYNLNEWKIKIYENMGARASVLPGSRKVKINGNSRFSKRDAKRLILHEIGVHAIRAQNGRKYPLKMFSTGLPGYLKTEEGLAVYNEFKNGIKDGLPLFALRVLGVHWALKHSFFRTFKLLRQMGADKEVAWRITVRCKRGLKYSADAGAYTKDASYLRGLMIIREAVRKDPSLFDKLLKGGKIGIEHLKPLNL